MVHLLDAALADGAVVGSIRLDATALGALVDHLALLEAHAVNVLTGRVASGNGSLGKK